LNRPTLETCRWQAAQQPDGNSCAFFAMCFMQRIAQQVSSDTKMVTHHDPPAEVILAAASESVSPEDCSKIKELLQFLLHAGAVRVMDEWNPITRAQLEKALVCSFPNTSCTHCLITSVCLSDNDKASNALVGHYIAR
jgi:hypothetical protein